MQLIKFNYYYFDTVDKRTKKLLPVKLAWHFGANKCKGRTT